MMEGAFVFFIISMGVLMLLVGVGIVIDCIAELVKAKKKEA